jgi:hypothetical protein
MVKMLTGVDPLQIIFKQLSILYIFLLVGWLVGKIKKEKASHSDIVIPLQSNGFDCF